MNAFAECLLLNNVIILTQLTIKVPNFGPKHSNFACKSQILFQKMLRSLGLETFAKFLRVSVSKNLVSEKSLGFGFGKFGPEKSLGFGFGKFGIVKKVSVSVKILVSSFSGCYSRSHGVRKVY